MIELAKNFAADRPPLAPEEIDYLLNNIDSLPVEEQQAMLQLLDEHQANTRAENAANDLIAFCQYIMPEYIVGKHHRLLADLLMRMENPEDDLDRVAVNIPPRHGKSQITSIFGIAWFLGKNPDKKVILASHTGDLAQDFGRKVRNIIATDRYQELFPGVRLAADSKAAGRWDTNQGGEFVAAGIGAALAGRGAHLLVIDDPHSEQDIINGQFETFERAYKWYTVGARTRLMPGGRVLLVQTRWHAADLCGRVVSDMQRNELADQFEVFEFPAIFETEQQNEAGETVVVEKPLWPEFYDLKALHRIKAGMPTYQWNAQYQQNPTAEEAAIVKRSWFRLWRKEDPPKVDYIIMTLDAAAEAHNRADFTAIVTFGVFYNEEEDCNQIILLNAVKERMEFPELKVAARAEYLKWTPDSFIVEKKSSGTPLYQELRRADVPVSEYTPTRGTANNPNTKFARLNSVADLVKSGLVWVPEHRWAEDFIEEVAGFPNAANDDQTDCFIMALMRFRAGNFVRLDTDWEREKAKWPIRRKRGYCA